MTLAAAVVGCGSIGAQFDADTQTEDYVLTHANACVQHSGVSLVAGIDTDPDSRQSFEAAWEKPSYPRLSAAVEAVDIDVVCISTPPTSHEAVVKSALDVGVSGIICEKPLAGDEESAERIVDRCSDAGVPLAVNYIRRYTPGIRWLRQAMRAGRSGPFETALFTFTKGLHTNGTHMVDLARWLFGDVTDIERHGASDPLLASFDCGDTRCRLVDTGVQSYSRTQMEAYGKSESVKLVDNGATLQYSATESNPLYSGFSQLSQRRSEATGIYRATYHTLSNMHAAVEAGKEIVCPGQDALETLRICHRLDPRAD